MNIMRVHASEPSNDETNGIFALLDSRRYDNAANAIGAYYAVLESNKKGREQDAEQFGAMNTITCFDLRVYS